MNIRRLAGILCLLLLTGFIQAPYVMAGDETPREGDLSRVRKKVEALRAWQLAEELDLDDETSSRLFPAMRQADQERWKIESRSRELIREMSRSLEQKNPDPERINKILNELQANRRELVRAEERHLDKVRQVLSPPDTARYLMFQIKFQKEIKRRAAQAFRGSRQSDDDGALRSRDRSDSQGQDNDGPGSGGSGGSSGGGDRGKR